MKHWHRSSAALLVTSLFTALPAQADVTAAQVWADWRDYLSSMGYTTEWTDVSEAGGALTVKGLKMTSSTPEATIAGEIEEIVMRETGDGRVEISMSPTYPLVADSTGSDGEKIHFVMNITNDALKMTASGTPDDVTYDFTATALGFAIDTVTVDDKPIDLVAKADISSPTGTYKTQKAAARTSSTVFTSARLDFEVTAVDPEGQGKFGLRGHSNNLDWTGSAQVPAGAVMSDMPAALKAGASFNGQIGYGATEYVLDFDEAGKTSHVEAKSDGGEFSVAMAKESLSYMVDSAATTMTMQSADLPFPVDVTFADSGFALLMPIEKKDEAAPFGLTMRMTDLKVSDAIWNMLDPGAILPRDPASLLVDLAGTAKVTSDFFDPAAAETMPQQPPGELHSLDIKGLRLAIAGAELTGTGALTFDNSDTTTFDGMPKPTGAVDLALDGGNALLDKLVQMGLIPQDQAMGARMMLGLFARPGDGPDSLVSKIEFQPDGSVMANGQRIR